jgi:hypothetical protein
MNQKLEQLHNFSGKSLIEFWHLDEKTKKALYPLENGLRPTVIEQGYWINFISGEVVDCRYDADNHYTKKMINYEWI